MRSGYVRPQAEIALKGDLEKESTFDTLKKRLMDELETFLFRVVNPETIRAIRLRIDLFLKDCIAHGLVSFTKRRWVRVSQNKEIPTDLVVEAHTAVWVHDCEKCTYLGQTTYSDKLYDLYVCEEEGSLGPTLIARYGSDGPEYTSMPAKLVHPDDIYVDWQGLNPKLLREVQLPLAEASDRYNWLLDEREGLHEL